MTLVMNISLSDYNLKIIRNEDILYYVVAGEVLTKGESLSSNKTRKVIANGILKGIEYFELGKNKVIKIHKVADKVKFNLYCVTHLVMRFTIEGDKLICNVLDSSSEIVTKTMEAYL